MFKSRFTAPFNLFMTKAQRLANAAKEFNTEAVTLFTTIECEAVKWELLTEILDTACSLDFEVAANKLKLDSNIIPTLSVLCQNIATRTAGFNWNILLFEIAKYLSKKCNNKNKIFCIKLLEVLQKNVFQERDISASGKVLKPEISISALPVMADVQEIFATSKRFYGLLDLPATLSLLSQLLIMIYLDLHNKNNQAVKDAKPRPFSTLSLNTRQIITALRKASEPEQVFLKALTTEFEPTIIVPPSDITFLQVLGNKLMIWQNVVKKPEDTDALPALTIHTLDSKGATTLVELPLFAQPFSASSDISNSTAYGGAGFSDTTPGAF